MLCPPTSIRLQVVRAWDGKLSGMTVDKVVRTCNYDAAHQAQPGSAYRMLTRIKYKLTLWQSMHKQNGTANAGGYEDSMQQQQWEQATADSEVDSSASEQSWQPEAGGSQEWPLEQEGVETQPWQQAPDDTVEWTPESEQPPAQNWEAVEQQEGKGSAEWVEPAEWSESAGPDGSSAEGAAKGHSAPEWVERVEDPKESASDDSEWSADSTWKEGTQEWPAESAPETSAENSWQSEQADVWEQDTLHVNPNEPAGEYAMPETEWASPATASSDEAEVWQVVLPTCLATSCEAAPPAGVMITLRAQLCADC